MLTLIILIASAAPCAALWHEGSLTTDEAWLAADNPHVIIDHVYVEPGVTLTIEDGVEVYSNAGLSIVVRGYLSALGSSSNDILFMGLLPSGYWDGLRFENGGSGTLEHCWIKRAGTAIDFGSFGGELAIVNTKINDCTTGIYASVGSGSLALTNCLIYNCHVGILSVGVAPMMMDANTRINDCSTGIHLKDIPSLNFSTPIAFRHNGYTGLHVSDCEQPIIDNMIMENNYGTRGAILMENCGDFTLGSGNTIGGEGVGNNWPLTITADSYPSPGSVLPSTGNTNNGIQVRGGSTRPTATWSPIGNLSYIITTNGMTISSSSELIIAPGVRVEFEGGTDMVVRGTLTALGVPGNEIIFSSNESNPGSIRFVDDGNGAFAHCLIEHGSPGIFMFTTGSVNVTDTTIRDCMHGVYATYGTMSIVNSRIIENSEYGVYVNNVANSNALLTFGSNLSEWNDIYGNGSGNPGRDYRNGSNDVDVEWVYWGTTNPLEIETHIWDEIDDESLGLVTYLPYSSEDHDYVITDVGDDFPVPPLATRSTVFQNHPNPFNPSTKIEYFLNFAGHARLEVFNVSGDHIVTLVESVMPAGRHSATWNGLDGNGHAVGSGIYLYRFTAENVIELNRMLLIK